MGQENAREQPRWEQGEDTLTCHQDDQDDQDNQDDQDKQDDQNQDAKVGAGRRHSHLPSG